MPNVLPASVEEAVQQVDGAASMSHDLEGMEDRQ